jgi:hypothetical protein
MMMILSSTRRRKREDDGLSFFGDQKVNCCDVRLVVPDVLSFVRENVLAFWRRKHFLHFCGEEKNILPERTACPAPLYGSSSQETHKDGKMLSLLLLLPMQMAPDTSKEIRRRRLTDCQSRSYGLCRN